MSQSRNYSLTMNNPKEPLDKWFDRLKHNSVYARAQLEKGEEGTPHFQACVGYKTNVRFKRMQKNFPGCHIEPTKNAMKAWAYCGKADTRQEGPLEHGVPPASKNVAGDTKARNAMLLEYGAVKAVEEGLIPLERFKQIKQSMDLYKVVKNDHKPMDELHNEWHWGKTGTGKSYTVRTKWPDAFLKTNTKWWDGYDGQETVIIEELGPDQIAGHHLKMWADHYPFPAETKGGSIHLRPKRIIITSNYQIEEVYEKSQDYEPLHRRFKVHHHADPFKLD